LTPIAEGGMINSSGMETWRNADWPFDAWGIDNRVGVWVYVNKVTY